MKRVDLHDMAPIGHTGYSYIMEYIRGSRLTEELSVGGMSRPSRETDKSQVDLGR